MLNIRDTRIIYAAQEKVLPGQILTEEGAALVYAKDGDGNTCVKLSTGANGEEFAGVQYSRFTPPAAAPLVSEFVVGATLTVKLPRAPITGQLFVVLAGQPATIVAAAPAQGEVQLNGSTLTFNAADEGSAGKYQLLYAPTVEEARQFLGDAPLGGLGIAEAGTTSALKDAVLGTSFYDASADWSTALYVKTVAGGKFAPASKSAGIPGVLVKSIPNSGSPFLVLSVKVA